MDRLPCLCLCRCLTGCFVCAAVVHPEGHQVREGALDTGMGSDSGALTQTRPGGFFNPPNSQLSPDSCRGENSSAYVHATVSPLQATQLQSLQSYKNKAVPAAALLFVHLERAHSLPVGPSSVIHTLCKHHSHMTMKLKAPLSLYLFFNS